MSEKIKLRNMRVLTLFGSFDIQVAYFKGKPVMFTLLPESYLRIHELVATRVKTMQELLEKNSKASKKYSEMIRDISSKVTDYISKFNLPRDDLMFKIVLTPLIHVFDPTALMRKANFTVEQAYAYTTIMEAINRVTAPYNIIYYDVYVSVSNFNALTEEEFGELGDTLKEILEKMFGGGGLSV